MVDAHYQHRTGSSPELVLFSRKNISYKTACDIIDRYPWASELELSDRYGEGGGFYFVAGAPEGIHAAYQFTPVDADRGLLNLELVLKKGWLGMIGRRAKSIDFDAVSTSMAKQKIRELFTDSPEALYEKYR